MIGEGTLHTVNDRVVELARSLKVIRGRKLRVDRTVVETNIHHPTPQSVSAVDQIARRRVQQRNKEVVVWPEYEALNSR